MFPMVLSTITETLKPKWMMGFVLLDDVISNDITLATIDKHIKLLQKSIQDHLKKTGDIV